MPLFEPDSDWYARHWLTARPPSPLRSSWTRLRARLARAIVPARPTP